MTNPKILDDADVSAALDQLEQRADQISASDKAQVDAIIFEAMALYGLANAKYDGAMFVMAVYGVGMEEQCDFWAEQVSRVQQLVFRLSRVS